ncbi:MAG: hypothetical protein J4F36_12930 [Nitrosopumilaceae archaeon]|nr:hypothetical protein [Nitrosopumilaceae archaeon]
MSNFISGLLDDPILLGKNDPPTQVKNFVFIAKNKKRYYQKYYADNRYATKTTISRIRKKIEKLDSFKKWR